MANKLLAPRLVIYTFSLVVTTVLVVSSCKPGNNNVTQVDPQADNWIQIDPQADNWMLAYDDITNSIWVTGPRVQKIIQKQLLEGRVVDINSINTPENAVVWALCVSSSPWVRTSKDIIYSYDEKSDKWAEIYKSNEDIHFCRTMQNGKLLFLMGENRIVEIEEGEVSVIEFNFGEITDIKVGKDDYLFVLTSDGGLYQGAGSQWEQVLSNNHADVGSSFEVYLSGPDMFWIATETGLYEWKTNIGNSPTSTLLLGIAPLSVRDVFVNNSGLTYVVTEFGIWRTSNFESTKMSLPNKVKKIYSSIYVYQTGDLFISTDDGVYLFQNYSE